MTPEFRARIDAFGRELTPELLTGTSMMMAGMFEGMDPQTIEEEDIAYGPDPRHRLDLYRQQNIEKAPVFVFVHGGGFVMGNKRNPPPSPFYRNVGDFAARHGWIGVVPTYPLAPEHPWPAGAEAVRGVVEWIREHAAEFGGDPERIVLSGQSAGAVHVAGYVAHARFHAIPGGGVRGAVLMSGIYDTTVPRGSEGEVAHPYYGTDRATFAEANCLPGLLSTDVPLCFTVSEFDAAMFQDEAARVAGAWGRAKGTYPEMHYLVGHNHLTPSQTLGSPVKDVEELVAGFVRRVTA
jgi:triacylglycerol lipase